MGCVLKQGLAGYLQVFLGSSVRPRARLDPRFSGTGKCIPVCALRMLPVNTSVCATEVLTGSSLKCEDPDIPDDTPSALVQMSSACRGPGFRRVLGAALCRPLALLPDAGVLPRVRTFPRVPLRLHADPGDRTGGHFKGEDLGHIRARAEAAFLSEPLLRAPCWGIAPSVLPSRPGSVPPAHRTPAQLALASARQPGGAALTVFLNSPSSRHLRGQRGRGNHGQPPSPPPCPLPSPDRRLRTPSTDGWTLHARSSQSRSGSGFSFLSYAKLDLLDRIGVENNPQN